MAEVGKQALWPRCCCCCSSGSGCTGRAQALPTTRGSFQATQDIFSLLSPYSLVLSFPFVASLLSKRDTRKRGSEAPLWGQFHF